MLSDNVLSKQRRCLDIPMKIYFVPRCCFAESSKVMFTFLCISLYLLFQTGDKLGMELPCLDFRLNFSTCFFGHLLQLIHYKISAHIAPCLRTLDNVTTPNRHELGGKSHV